LHALGIGKENLHFVSSSFLFHGCYWLDPWRNIRAYTLHQVLSLLLVEKAIAKVARRSKRAYTLLDFTLLGLLAQGSKRAYTP
jgi:hypothetical protein